MTVLLVDGDACAIENNSDYLASKGYGVLKAAGGKEALPLAESADCVVLDMELPDINGCELASMIIKRKPVPVLFLTALYSDDVIERAFALGGDYMRKPHSLKELHLRIGAMLQKAPEAPDGMLRLPPMLIDTRRLSVRVDGRELFLTPREYAVLMFLCRTPNRLFPHEVLFKELWGGGEVSPHLVQQNVSTLRNKLEKAVPGVRFIKTVHGSGYMFRYPPESAKP